MTPYELEEISKRCERARMIRAKGNPKRFGEWIVLCHKFHDDIPKLLAYIKELTPKRKAK